MLRFKKILIASLVGYLLLPTTASAASCCVCTMSAGEGSTESIFSEITNSTSCKVRQDQLNESPLVSFLCLMMESDKCAPVTIKLEEEFKFSDMNTVLGIKIPNLSFSAPPTEIDEEGNVYIPWIGEYIKAVYYFALIAISVIAVVVLIMQGARIIISAGGPEKADAYKGIAGAVIGLFIAWGSYVILFSINPALTQFQSLKIKFIPSIPAITFIDTPIESLSDEDIPQAPNAGGAPSKVPDFKQFNSKWAKEAFGPLRVCECGTKDQPGTDYELCHNNLKNNVCCTNMHASGCGPTSLAMIFSAYGTQDATPDKVADFIGQPGNGRVCNSGTSIRLTLKNLNDSPWSDFKYKEITKDETLKLLAEKKPIIFLCSKCTGISKIGSKSYDGGHYMVLTSIDEQGNIKVNDPGGNAQKGISSMTTSQLDKNGGFWYVYR